MKYRLAAILISLVFNSIAQVNLVPNPSFEEYSICPNSFGQIVNANNWQSPTSGTPDYYNICSSNSFSSVPTNELGYQYPFDGNAYCGITLYSDLQGDGREYIQAQLTEPLKDDAFYCISFSFAFCDNYLKYYTNTFGVALSNSSITASGSQSPPIQFSSYSKYDGEEGDTSTWFTFSSLYQGTGAENFITIGNFELDSQTHLSPTNFSGNNYAVYIFIDNISVVECDTILSPIAPNIFTPNSDGVNDVFQIEFLPANSKLAVYNRWGGTVYQSDNYQNNWDGQNHSPGVYYYILTLPGGNTKKGTITLLRD